MRCAHKGFTLVEVLAVGLVVSLLAAAGYGVFLSALERGQAARCVSNLRQWGAALALYEQDHDGRIPRRGQGVRPVEILDRPDDWFNCLPPYLGLPGYGDLCARGRDPKPRENSVFVCPAAKNSKQRHFLSYGMNMYLSPWNRPDMHRVSQIPAPSQLAFLADGPGGWASTVPSSQAYSVKARHLGSANVLFVDGHIQAFSGKYLGCGEGNSSKPDVRWLPGTDGVNQLAVP